MKTFLLKSALFAHKILFIGMLWLFLYNGAEAQNTEEITLSKVNLYADAGFLFAGQATINFEWLISSNEKVNWYARAGAGAAGVIMAFGGPGGLAAATMLTGKGNKHFELSTGVFVGKDLGQESIFVLPLVDIGYRYQKPEGGFIFKAKAGILGIGIGLGYAF